MIFDNGRIWVVTDSISVTGLRLKLFSSRLPSKKAYLRRTHIFHIMFAGNSSTLIASRVE